MLRYDISGSIFMAAAEHGSRRLKLILVISATFSMDMEIGFQQHAALAAQRATPVFDKAVCPVKLEANVSTIMTQRSPVPAREAVGVFQSEDALQAAIDDLLSHGFDRAEISLLARSDSVEKKLGHAYRKVAAVEDDAAAPRIAYVAEEDVGNAEGAVIGTLMYVGALAGLIPVVASGGALAAALVALLIGGASGGALGAALARIIGNEHAEYIADQLEHGGLALWVRTWNEGDEARATKILKAHSGKDVHLHGLPDLHPVMEERYLGAISEAEAEAYQAAGLVHSGDDAYYVGGKVFSSAEDARSYVERQTYLESLRVSARSDDFDLNAALIDPASTFHTVANLLAAPLSNAVKLELLKRWAYDAKSLEVAEGEGMIAPANRDKLQAIARAIADLKAMSCPPDLSGEPVQKLPPCPEC